MVSSDYYIADNPDIENQKLEAAKSLFYKKDYRGALKLYLDMLNSSLSYKLYYEIGRCYYKLDEMLPAEEYFKKSIGLENFKNPSYLYLGNIVFKREDINKAIEYWINAYAYKPDDSVVCLNLATSYFRKGMNFQSIFFYEKCIKYTKVKDESFYAIKSSIEKCKNISQEYLQKAKQAINDKQNKIAIESLNYAIKNYPIDFDINLLLGKLYFEENNYILAINYLRQALCLDNKSLDVLQMLSSAFINVGDFTSAYCIMRKLLPLVLHNQAEYLKILKIIKELDASFDNESYQIHKNMADKYYNENNYHIALMEYENCIILKDTLLGDISDKIDRIKHYLHPEKRIIDTCMEKGREFYSSKNFQTANKYFSKVILLSNENSAEYKFAKSKINENI